MRECNTHDDVLNLQEKYFLLMEKRHKDYLESVANQAQFAASCCAMSSNVFMYMRSTSSGGESMNAANLPIRERTAVDCVNTMLLMYDYESNRFANQRNMAWAANHTFTQHGMMMFHEIA